MGTLRRRVRAALVVGATWAATWLGAGLVMLAIVGLDAADVPFPLFFGLLGFLAGTTFAGVLAVAERHRRFDQMSIPRFGAWGAFGGVLLSLVISFGVGGELGVLAPVFGVAGAASAAGSLAIARKGQARASLPAADEDA